MESLHSRFALATGQAIKAAGLVEDLENVSCERLKELALVSRTKSTAFGDYQSNAAMSLFKSLSESKKSADGLSSPKAVAEAIARNLPDSLTKDVCEKVTVTPQGFISFFVSAAWTSKELEAAFVSDFDLTAIGTGHRVLVDFSSPNIAKEMHVGHLRSTILGETVCRALEKTGHSVSRINHLGDWGTQFGMLIEHINVLFKEEKGAKRTAAENPKEFVLSMDLTSLTELYKAAKLRFDEEPDFKTAARKAVVGLQAGDPSSREIWSALVNVSLQEFARIYNLLDVKINDRGESFYNEMIPGVVQELDEMGLVSDSDGARCAFVPNDKVPLILVKSDGGYGYDSTDVAAVKHRLITEKHDRVIVLTDAGQSDHFVKVYKLAELAKWHVPGATILDHAGFGLVLGPDGKKFKTREGKTVQLKCLLEAAIGRAKFELLKRREETGTTFSDEDIESMSLNLGVSSVRYFDLKQHRTTNYRYEEEKMIDPKGNTAIYLLYAYARVCAILRSAEADSLANFQLEVAQSEEVALAVHALRYRDVVEATLAELLPHFLTEYVYDLAILFTQFYSKCRVVKSAEEKSRLKLCLITKRLFEHVFYLLGIVPLQRL